MTDILVMDDDADYTSVLREVLEDASYHVTIASTATDALAMLKEKKFDLLITDIIVFKGRKSVPDGGISLISRLRGPLSWNTEEGQNELPIIAISGAIHNQGMSGILKTARSLGADAALAKPTDIEELLKLIKGLLEKEVQES